MRLQTNAQTQYGAGVALNTLIAMAKLTIHGKPEEVEQIKDELPDGVSWTEYILECVELRKRMESRELILVDPNSVTFDRD